MLAGHQLIGGWRRCRAERFQPHVRGVVAHQPGRQDRHQQGDDRQQQPSGPPAVGPEAAVEERHQYPGQHDGGAVAADHQPGGLAALVAAEPVADQCHGGDVGEAGAHADQEVERQRDEKAVAGADAEQ